MVSDGAITVCDSPIGQEAWALENPFLIWNNKFGEPIVLRVGSCAHCVEIIIIRGPSDDAPYPSWTPEAAQPFFRFLFLLPPPVSPGERVATMISNLLALIPIVLGTTVAAQSNPSIVCVAGQCLQGFTNITIGATLSTPGSSASVQLLPGQYTSDTNPQLLHTLLTSSSATLAPSPGFNNSTTVSLPLTVALEAGVAAYAQANYSGAGTFTQLPQTNGSLSSTSISAGSLMLSSNVWTAVSSGSASSDRLILWDSIPDLSQLPSGASAAKSSLSILEIQSSACSPPCSGAGICSASGTCTCPTGFTGSSCESCAQGFFGPNCQPCPQGCTSCDEGISGTGRCLSPQVSNPPSSCNCLNGVCGSNGQCSCNAGWTSADNGTACANAPKAFSCHPTAIVKLAS
ncbi:hypothetical protein QCA50_007572 [Cerrena zonata]|uniref:EGF-like domain-containing protein n=1 Tax=Cerrena zonata TaxID=2478898 RepID=A0AAW0G680_9APHY